MYQEIGTVLGARASTQLATSALPAGSAHAGRAAAAPAPPLASAAGHAVRARAVRTM